ncbi:hypothetical protein GF391_01875 [Candidatus Uhrbacteria bacterium]|nr:hypothetical protein [Candidatus Uhrbacteria bacterium]
MGQKSPYADQRMAAKIKFFNNERKFGFLTTEDGDDIYIPAKMVKCAHIVPGAQVKIVVQLNKRNRRDKWWLREMICVACVNQRKNIRQQVEADIKRLAPETAEVTWRGRSFEVDQSVLFWVRHEEPAKRTAKILKETMEVRAACELLTGHIKELVTELPEVVDFVEATQDHKKLMSELESRLPPTKMVRRYARNPYSMYDGDSDISDDSWLVRADGLQPRDMASQEEKQALDGYLSDYPDHMRLERKLEELKFKWHVMILYGLKPRPGLEISPWADGKDLLFDERRPTASAVFGAADKFLNSVAKIFAKAG